MAEGKVYEIVSHKWDDNDKGKYLVVEIKGQQSPKRVFDEEAQKQFQGNGKYELKWKKNGQYFNIAGFKKLSESTTVVGTNGSRSVSYSLDPNERFRNKAICAQVAGRAAADVVVAIIAAEKREFLAFKNRDEIISFASQFTEALLAEFKSFVNGADAPAQEKSDVPKGEVTRESVGV